MKLWVYVARRIGETIPILVGVATVLFAISSTLPLPEQLAPFVEPVSSPSPVSGPCPGGPDQPGPPACSDPGFQQAARTLGLGSPIPVRWAIYVYHAFTGQWGHLRPFGVATITYDLSPQTSVSALLGWTAPYTWELLAAATVIAVGVTALLGLGLTSGAPHPAGRLPRWIGYAAASYSALFASIALVWLVLVISQSSTYCNISGFFGWLGSWPPPACFPGGATPSWIGPAGRTGPSGIPALDGVIHGEWLLGADSIRRLALPALALAIGLSANALRRWEASDQERDLDRRVLLERRASGFFERDVHTPYRRIASTSRALQQLAPSASLLVAGLVGVEYVFGLHGVGSLFLDSLQRPIDWGLLSGAFFLLSVASVSIGLLLDCTRAVIDPTARIPASQHRLM